MPPVPDLAPSGAPSLAALGQQPVTDPASPRSVAQAKHAWRQALLARRRRTVEPAAVGAQRDAAVLRWVDARRGGTPWNAVVVGLYVAVGTEPGTSFLRRALRCRGARVVLPALRPDGGLALLRDIGTVVPGARGTWQPPAPDPQPAPPHHRPAQVPAAALTVLLLPGLAADLWGVRLGRGGGAYDRLLAEPGAPPPADRVVLLRRDELVGRLPWTAHDARVGWAALPDGLTPLGGTAGPG